MTGRLVLAQVVGFKNSSSLSNLLSRKLSTDKKYAFKLGCLCTILSIQCSKESQPTDACFKIFIILVTKFKVLSKFAFPFRTFIKAVEKINAKILNAYITYLQHFHHEYSWRKNFERIVLTVFPWYKIWLVSTLTTAM